MGALQYRGLGVNWLGNISIILCCDDALQSVFKNGEVILRVTTHAPDMTFLSARWCEWLQVHQVICLYSRHKFQERNCREDIF